MRDASRAIAAEVRAMLHQAWLLARARHAHDEVADAPRAVVLVHGFLAKAPVLAPLGQRIRAELGLPVLWYDYPSFGGFRSVAEGLAAMIDEHVPKATRVSLVGHSLGGIVCRWYAQELGGVERVDRVVTLATPHSGMRRAGLARGSCASVLHPRSPVLETLLTPARACVTPPLTSIVAEMDHLVPLAAGHVDGARVFRLPAVGHNGVLYDARAHRLVLDALR